MMLANVLAVKAKKKKHRKDFDRKGKKAEISVTLAEKRSQSLLLKKTIRCKGIK